MLYLPPRRRFFGCRHRYRLTYESCREAHRFDNMFAMLGASGGMSGPDAKRLLKKRWRL